MDNRWMDPAGAPGDGPDDNYNDEQVEKVDDYSRPYEVRLHVRVPLEGMGLVPAFMRFDIPRFKLDEFLSVLNDNDAAYTVRPLFETKIVEGEDRDG